MASSCETLRLGRLAPRRQVVAIGLIKFSLLSVAGLSLHFYESSAMHQRGMTSSCETLRLGRLAPRQQVVAIGLIKFSLLSVAGLSLHFYESSAMHQRGMTSSCETLRLDRLAPQQQVVAIGLIKSLRRAVRRDVGQRRCSYTAPTYTPGSQHVHSLSSFSTP
jgi:hypothetical protein